VDQGPRGWIRPYGSWADHTAQGSFSGYDHNIYGTLVGLDWVRGDVLLGFAGGYARSVISQDDGDFSEARTGYGVGYVSLGTEDWFGDINVAVGRSDIEDRSGAAFGNRADYKATDLAVYLGGGKEMWSSCGRFCLTPEASVLMSDYYQQAYVEEGIRPRKVSAYDRVSIVSGLGATVAMQQEFDTLILKPEARVRWLHEFNNDAQTVDYSLVGGSGMYRFALPDAEENIIETGAGLTCQFDDQLSLGVDLDWRFGEDFDAYGISGRLELEF
jgi:outer membrane autotransporter protein